MNNGNININIYKTHSTTLSSNKLLSKPKQIMSVTLVASILALIVVTNGSYVTETELGCHGNMYWNFGNSISNVVDNASNKESCKLACNNNINCDGWGINVNNNECNIFTFIDGGFVYNCESNDAVTHEGGIKECLTNDKLKSSRIVGLNGNRVAGKFEYDAKTQCFKKTLISAGMFIIYQ